MAKVLVTMPDGFLEKIDSVANREQRTRSELIREALRGYIKRNNVVNNERANANATLLDDLLS